MQLGRRRPERKLAKWTSSCRVRTCVGWEVKKSSVGWRGCWVRMENINQERPTLYTQDGRMLTFNYLIRIMNTVFHMSQYDHGSQATMPQRSSKATTWWCSSHLNEMSNGVLEVSVPHFVETPKIDKLTPEWPWWAWNLLVEWTNIPGVLVRMIDILWFQLWDPFKNVSFSLWVTASVEVWSRWTKCGWSHRSIYGVVSIDIAIKPSPKSKYTKPQIG